MTTTTPPGASATPADRDPGLPEPQRRRFVMLMGAVFGAGLSTACGGGETPSAASPTPPATPAAPSQGEESPSTPVPQDDPSPTESPATPAGAIVGFSLRRSTGGAAVPFALGQVFRKGDVSSGATLAMDTAAFQITPISLWDDGSVKHALIAGKVDLEAGIDKVVGIRTGAAAAGPVLTETDLIAADPAASVAYGSYGTVTLGPLLGTSARVLTEHAGPQYAAFQYIANFPNDASVRAIFYVQLWAGGHYRIRVAVENGSAGSASSAKSGTATVSIAGMQRLAAAVSMPQYTRWDAIGASFDEAAAAHDPVYLRASKLVPNYGYTNPSEATLQDLHTGYVPMAGMGWEQDMGAPGYAAAIGLLPHWDALYCTTGDRRAYGSSIAHSRAYGVYSIYYRDPATNRMPRLSHYPTLYVGDERLNGGGAYTWEFAHHPNAGYLPWLLTAERFHLETLQANAWACYITNNNQPSESAGLAIYQDQHRVVTSQTRGRAWRFRTYAAVAAVSPTGDLVAADCRANVAANLARWKTMHVDTNSPSTGLLGIYDDKSSTAGFQHSIFESMFLVAAIGWAWDMEPGLDSSQKAQHLVVRDYAYRAPVGLTGRGSAYEEYAWQYAPGPYQMVIGESSSTASLYSTWGAVYQATYPGAPTGGTAIKEGYADNASANAFPQSNWGHVMTALSYAKDHGAPGAADSYARVVGASNWSSNAVKYNDWPQYGVVSRT